MSICIVPTKPKVQKIPRRPHPRKLKKSQLIVKTVPHWRSCPEAQTTASIWSMAATDTEAIYAGVLAMSIKVRSNKYPANCKPLKISPFVFNCRIIGTPAKVLYQI